ncbi:MAG: hypothetical protein HYR76_02770 [Ignavibacteria bacterium]|nr:hypothetical protein [Ignavibacteria bacterium]MBI3765862.1 hypothetical protein [Ignavibacteriales bacterium]
MPSGKQTGEHEELHLMTHGSRYPLQAAFHVLGNIAIMGVLATMTIVVINLARWSFRPDDLISYFFEGFGIVVAGSGVERIWNLTVKEMLRNPLSWYALLTRIPFWFMAGGMGYLIGLLLAKRFGLLDFYEVPVKPLFVVGARLGMGVLGVHYLIRQWTPGAKLM